MNSETSDDAMAYNRADHPPVVRSRAVAPTCVDAQLHRSHQTIPDLIPPLPTPSSTTACLTTCPRCGRASEGARLCLSCDRPAIVFIGLALLFTATFWGTVAAVVWPRVF